MNARAYTNLWADELLTTTTPQIRGQFVNSEGKCALGVLIYCVGRTANELVPLPLQSQARAMNDSGRSFRDIGRWLKQNLPADEAVPEAAMPVTTERDLVPA